MTIQAPEISSRVKTRTLQIEPSGENYLLSCPEIGAVSLMTKLETVLFPLLRKSDNPGEAISTFLRDVGYGEDSARKWQRYFFDRVTRDGWSREALEPNVGKPLTAVYLTITLKCNMTCQYCYQEFDPRRHMGMTRQTFDAILDAVLSINPDCHFVVTGGEPLVHKQAFEFLDEIEDRAASFSILSNGVLISDEVAERLSGYTKLSKVQVSLDGITEETNAITRGKRNLERTLAGIGALARHGVAISIAPTIHRRNLEEMEDIARYGLSIGAELSPNNLRDANGMLPELDLPAMEAYRALKTLNTNMAKEMMDNAPVDAFAPAPAAPEDASAPAAAQEIPPTLVCGMAHSVVNFDHNGDIFPCHMLAVKEMKMGNAVTDDLWQVLTSEETRQKRVCSTDIEKCQGCKFVARCGGGCRAGAYYSFGQLNREDSICDVLHQSHLDGLRH